MQKDISDLLIDAEAFKQRLAALGIDRSKLTYEQLVCINARINGEWDNPLLVKYGALSFNMDEDIKRMAQGLDGID